MQFHGPIWFYSTMILNQLWWTSLYWALSKSCAPSLSTCLQWLWSNTPLWCYCSFLCIQIRYNTNHIYVLGLVPPCLHIMIYCLVALWCTLIWPHIIHNPILYYENFTSIKTLPTSLLMKLCTTRAPLVGCL